MKLKIYTLFFSIFLLLTCNSLLFLSSFSFSNKNNYYPTENKVCLIIVDGLRYDSLKYMPEIKKKIENNECLKYKLLAEVPSISRPGYERIISGVPTEKNGVKKNEYILPSMTKGLIDLLNENNLTIAISAFNWFNDLYPTGVKYKYYYFLNDKNVFKMGTKFLEKYTPDLVIIHPLLLDRIGHKYGGVSNEYRGEVTRIDKKISDFFKYADLHNYTIMITSDHGHKDIGGHGDNHPNSIEVPLYIIKPTGSKTEYKNIVTGNQIDIAPTICSLLGVTSTKEMQGKTLVKNEEDIREVNKAYIHERDNIFKTFSYLFLIVYISDWLLIFKAIKMPLK